MHDGFRNPSPSTVLLIVTLACTCLVFRPGSESQLAFAQARERGSRHPLHVAQMSDSQDCAKCHQEEVTGFMRSAMAHSMRRVAQEPSGIVRTGAETIRVSSNASGTWQEIRTGNGETNRQRVDYVIGSGQHAQGYLSVVSDHIFQSPIAYYTRASAYGLAPGFERATDPDFSRAVTPACLFCHAGGTMPVAGTENEYSPPFFKHVSISCDRCHGDVADHLKNPSASNIVNPAELHGSARDSVCEQCHLFGAARILNPGKSFADFRAGEPLEKTFTTYRSVGPGSQAQGLRVISHSEQLALSSCARNSNGKLWCGTCHDPHNEPTDTVSFYRERCLSCHNKTTFAPTHPPRTSDCISCHMPRRNAVDGGHTTFTDHRIQRSPEPDVDTQTTTELIPWREPEPDLRERNLGLALVGHGIEKSDPSEIVRGYKLLTSLQDRFASDPELFTMIGNALLLGRQSSEAVEAFEIAVRLDPNSASRHASLAGAYLAVDRNVDAQKEFERSLQIDPLQLDAAKHLIDLYDRMGDRKAATELAASIAALSARQDASRKPK